MVTSEAEQRVVRAVEGLLREDAALFDLDVNERTITQRLAVHLEREFVGWHVDCEYNRKGRVAKQLDLTRPNGPRNRVPTPVFPDIIIHRRATNENLVVIEAKKTTNGRGDERDREKLHAFREQLGYRVAVFLLLAGGQRPGVVVDFLDGPRVEVSRPKP